MKTIAAVLAIQTTLWSVPTSDVTISGFATYYAPGLVRQVANTRGIDLVGFADGVVLNRAGDLARTVWLEWADGTVDGPLRVIDCAQRGKHFLERETRKPPLVVEVSANLAKRRGFYGKGPVPVRVWFQDPRHQ